VVTSVLKAAPPWKNAKQKKPFSWVMACQIHVVAIPVATEPLF